MKLNGREVDQIVVTNKKGEVLAVISDSEIIEEENVSVIVDFGD